MADFGQLTGQGWAQAGELALALALSAAIGLEREIRQKAAGLRTHTLVGFASALFVLVSKYGFTDVVSAHDPSRVAAQVVSGIGFIGAGLIFVRRDAVHGLTTAAIVWLTCAVGMAAGAGLWLLAVLVTAGHFLVLFAFTPLAARLPRSKYAPSRLRLTYVEGRGVLRETLALCAERGFAVSGLSLEQHDERREPRVVSVWVSVHGTGSVNELVDALARIPGMLSISSDDANAPQA